MLILLLRNCKFKSLTFQIRLLGGNVGFFVGQDARMSSNKSHILKGDQNVHQSFFPSDVRYAARRCFACSLRTGSNARKYTGPARSQAGAGWQLDIHGHEGGPASGRP
jgi:hypothetical protein